MLKIQLLRFVLASFLFLSSVCPSFAETPYGLVNPIIGTAHAGQTIPMAGVPFAMTGWTPETIASEGHCVAPYYYKETKLTGFRGTHWMSGSCTQDYGSVTLMPLTGKLHTLPLERAETFQHSNEKAAPAYYSVQFDNATRVELTGTTHTGMLRIRFPKGSDAHLVIDSNAHPNEGYIRVMAERDEIVGYNPVHRLYQKKGEPAGFRGYFVIRFAHPFTRYGTWCGFATYALEQERKGGCPRLGAYVSFPQWKDGEMLVKVGMSFTSIEEAEKNLDAEDRGWNFESVRKNAESQWKQLLERIEVQGGTHDQRQTFYTALYHASLSPRIVNDADGTYAGFGQEGKLHHTDTAYYDDFSLWDTFRALHPLLTILDPAREEQMVQSLILKGEQGGYLPIFPAWNNYTGEMIGDPSVPVIVDAWNKGLRNFDAESAWTLIRKNAMTTPSEEEYKDGKGRRALDSYLSYGFIPLEDKVPDAYHHQEQVSRTLEYAYDDALAADFAASLGHAEDAATLRLRGNNWRNVFDPSKGFVRGRYADGSWAEPFQPDHSYPWITEGKPWQYSFFVPQDIPGLIAAMGGEHTFAEKLDGLFTNDLYEQGNEPSHGIAWLYNYAGAPEKTQRHVREILAQYNTTPGGLPGNDDAGQMSAWYLFGAMGFYPVVPGKPSYAVARPIFSRIVIHLSNGRQFTIITDESSPHKKYIQSATLNGKVLRTLDIEHSDITSGATLHLSFKPPA